MKQENMNGKFSRRNFVKLATVTLSTAGPRPLRLRWACRGTAKRDGDQGKATAGRRRRIT